MRAPHLYLITASLALATGAGNANCPCLTSYGTTLPTDSNGRLIVMDTHRYLPTYGLSTCSAHDSGLAPYCNDANVTRRPAWCADNWCYVDPSNCVLPTSETSYFPNAGLYYSYTTCGDANTFDQWFGNNSVSGAHSLTDIIGVVTNYLRSMVNTLEDNHAELSAATPGTCEIHNSCPCVGCQVEPVWSMPPPNPSNNSITFAHTTLTQRVAADQTGSAGRMDRCLSRAVDTAFMRIASKEADVNRVGYEYYGSQQLGNYMQWPGIDWCPATYDPRYRNWYTGGVSGPKDLVIVIDVSGSMTGPREALARSAAQRVVDTLTEADYATIVTFSSGASSYSSRLVQATSSTRTSMNSWITSNVGASGSTNYRAAFTKVWDILGASTGASQTSGCNRLVLFLSDGQPNEWVDSDYSDVQSEATRLGNVHIMTYALGTGADSDKLKQLSCENSGIFHAVPDNGNLADTMATYYSLLSSLLRPCRVRWTEYNDWFTGLPLLSACLAAYEKSNSAAATSCNGGLDGLGDHDDTSGTVPKLIGVACMDLSLIVSQATIMAHPQWPTFWSEVQSQMASCPRTVLQFEQLQNLRRQVSSASVCDAPAVSPPPSPPLPPYPPNITGMVVGITFGGIAGVCFLLILVGLIYKKCKEGEKWQPNPRPGGSGGGGSSSSIEMASGSLADKAAQLQVHLGLAQTPSLPTTVANACKALGVRQSELPSGLNAQIDFLYARTFSAGAVNVTVNATPVGGSMYPTEGIAMGQPVSYS